MSRHDSMATQSVGRLAGRMQRDFCRGLLATGKGPVANLRRRLQRLHPGLLELLLARQ